MKKVVVASLLAFTAAVSIATGTPAALAQSQVNLGSQAASDVQMSPAEYTDYNNAIGQTDPKAKAAALEAYLTKYPQSAVKASVLTQLMQTYSAFDPTKSLDAADRLLQLEPNNIGALTIEVYFRKASADTLTDPAAKQAALDSAAGYAQKGLAATKPAAMDDATFTKAKSGAAPYFYSAIATAALNKKDMPTAIDNFKKELASVPEDQTKIPGALLTDTYLLATAYYQSAPPDLINCTWYASRAAAFAPEPYKTQMMPLAKFCYKKYHGADDGYDTVLTASQASLNPPATLAIKPAPTPASIVDNVIATTPDLGTLAVSDKEFILQNGTPEQAAKVWDTVKGKSVQLPDVVVIAVKDNSVQVAVSDDAVQSKTADFTFNLKAPDDAGAKPTPAQAAAAKKEAADKAALLTVGNKVTLTGTYDSFTPKPIMIIMSDGDVVLPKKTPAKPAPVHHTAPHK
jgi:hypothetical protein